MKPISPTALAKASQCLHSWHLECFGDPAWKREPDEGLQLMWERGLDHERDMVKSLADVAEPAWDGKDWQAGFEATVALMKAGRPWIYQGVLVGGPLRGFPDLLKKVDGASALGGFTYDPVDVKGHKAITLKDRYQLAAYARMLEPVLGARPTRGGIWLNTGKIEEIDLARDAEQFEALLARLEQVRAGALATEGVRCGECGTCLWLDHCAARWKESGHVCLLYGVTGGTARKLSAAGFRTWRDVADSEPGTLAKKAGMKEDAAVAALQHAQAWLAGKPQVRKPPVFPEGVPIHFYDIETYESCVYLHGVIRVHEGKREEKQFFARNPAQEGKVWRQFLDWLARDDKAHVWCWADYERGFAHRLWQKYGGNPKGWVHLDKNLADQCAWVRKHFALPVSGYGIKKVAPLFGFRWRAEDAGGLNSEAWYGEWLGKGDKALLAKILRYNLDDVLAMDVINAALRRHVTGGHQSASNLSSGRGQAGSSP